MFESMLFALLLLADSAALETALLQQQLDQLVEHCRAAQAASLVAHEGRQVEFMPLAGDHPSDAEKQQLRCVLTGLQLVPDLSFGFIGNIGKPR
jgi:hypothetical protein